MQVSSKVKKEARSLVLAILFALTIRWLLLEAYVIPSESMLPTLLVHDHIFVNKILYGLRVPFGKTWLTRWNTPHRGDVLVFKNPEDESIALIKRVIGVPGDKISYDGTQLFINGSPVELAQPKDKWDFDWLDREKTDPDGNHYARFVEMLPTDSKSSVNSPTPGLHPHSLLHITGAGHAPQPLITVPDGSLFMMGDNRDDSRDSRFWGFAPIDNVLGKAMFIWLSCKDTIPGIGICSPLSLRGSRFFHWVN